MKRAHAVLGTAEQEVRAEGDGQLELRTMALGVAIGKVRLVELPTHTCRVYPLRLRTLSRVFLGVI